MNHHDHHAPAELRASPAGGTLTDVPERETATQRTRPADRRVGSGFWAAAWNAITAAIATVAGIAPHVLHHIGLFAGAFLITGAAGNLLFGALGLVLSIPLLRRLYRRFGTWRAPAVAVGVFTVMFSLSAFVIGPAVAGSDEPATPVPVQSGSPDDHAGHHG